MTVKIILAKSTASLLLTLETLPHKVQNPLNLLHEREFSKHEMIRAFCSATLPKASKTK